MKLSYIYKTISLICMLFVTYHSFSHKVESAIFFLIFAFYSDWLAEKEDKK